MPTYRENVTDKQQTDIERAEDDSSIRIPWFDGKSQQTGQIKVIRANDLSAQANADSTGASSAVRQFSDSGMSIGSHNDKPFRFETPGRA